MRARILIVDDDHAYVAGVTEYLEANGFEVIAANSFEAAKHALLTDGPQLVIVDVRLGAFNGLQLISTGRVKVPAIVVTGFDDPVLRAEAAGFGAQYVVKPIVPTELLTLVRQLLTEVGEAR